MLVESYWFLLIAVAAVANASWNFLLKQSEDKFIFLWSLRIWAVVLFLPVSIGFWPTGGIPLKHLLFWGLGSILLHGLYAKVLARAYEDTDFSLAYPVARGLGPLITVFAGILFLKEQAGVWVMAGTFLILLGMYIQYSRWDLTAGKKTIKALTKNPLPIMVGISIAAYSVFDKMAMAYIPAIILNVIENTGQVAMLSTDVRKKHLADVLAMWKKNWYKMAVAGFLSAISYILVLIVLTDIPVSKVAPVRESSIIIGTLLGMAFLKEEFSIDKIIGSVIIFVGVVAIVIN